MRKRAGPGLKAASPSPEGNASTDILKNQLNKSSTAELPSVQADDHSPSEKMDLSDMSRTSQWIVLAVASGACAAINGVFAKLTTTELTTTFSTAITHFLGLNGGAKAVEAVVRAIFFLLNMTSNAIMWVLFTKALARGTSTTQVTIINTSANFMITALLGFIVFSESLPLQWWLGASLLVVGNVIIGRREEKEVDSKTDIHEHGDDDALLEDSIDLTEEVGSTFKRQGDSSH